MPSFSSMYMYMYIHSSVYLYYINVDFDGTQYLTKMSRSEIQIINLEKIWNDDSSMFLFRVVVLMS